MSAIPGCFDPPTIVALATLINACVLAAIAAVVTITLAKLRVAEVKHTQVINPPAVLAHPETELEVIATDTNTEK